MSKTGPDFIIIGAMKSATTTLHDQLSILPGVFMSRIKEPCFFSNDQQYARGHDWYASLFADAQPEDLCGEASTDYTKLPTFPKTVERMQRYLPHVKLIYLMRNPIERLLSHYAHDWTVRSISDPIDKAIQHYPELINYSLYSMQLMPYIQAYGSNRILLVFFDSFTTNPQAELERICHFIGYHRKPPVWNKDLPPKNVTGERLRKNSVHKFLLDRPVLQEIRRIFIPKIFRDWITSRFFRMDKKPQLSPALKDDLKATFDKDLSILSSWVGFPITCDTWKEKATRHFPEIHAEKVG